MLYTEKMKRMKPVFALQLLRYAALSLVLFWVAGCSALLPPGLGPQPAEECISRGWPHDRSDLRPDPALVFGTLANGVRYVIMPNREPEDRVGLFLNIQAGSLHEADAQRGYAHFLEHMLFNGTTHYPPGTLVEYFQSIGMSFGADTNAHTTFDETVYKILLPDGGRKHLEEGMLVMADYARGALLLEEEVERERGIILAEKRTRDSASYRLYEKRMQFSLAGTRAAERLPIGTDEALARADAGSLRAFYDTWYRPENMILVVVGDTDLQLVREVITEQFSTLSAPTAEPLCFEYGKIDEQSTRALYVAEPEIGSTEVSIGSSWNTVPRIDSHDWQAEQVKWYVANTLLNNRLHKLISEPGSILTKAQTYAGIFLNRYGYATLSATVEGEKWQQALQLLNITLRQALESGFTDRELERGQKEIIAQLEKQVHTAGSRDSRHLANQIIHKLNSNEVFLSPQQELEFFGPVVKRLTLDEVNKVFRSLWAHKNRMLLVEGTAVIDAGTTVPEEVILDTFRQSEQTDLPAWENGSRIAFPYLPAPVATGLVVQRENLSALDMERVRYENGTVLTVKRTDFQPNEVLVAVHFGNGRLGEPQPGLGILAEAVVRESGLGGLTRSELEEALAGTSVDASFRVGPESFAISGKGLKGELELLFQLLRAQLVDPAFRPEAYALSMERFSQMYDQLSSSVEGMLRLKAEQFLAGGNTHYGLPPRDLFMQLGLDRVREWLTPVLAQGVLEVSVVGDIDLDEVVTLAGRYFGSLDRLAAPVGVTEQITFPAGEKRLWEADTNIDKALVMVAWPTDDFWDIARTRRLNILAAVLDDRLRLEIREKLGAVYSPAVYNAPSRVAPGYGVLRAMMTVDPAEADSLVAKVGEIATGLAERGITDEELRRSLEPSLTSIKDMMKTNRYWMESVLSLSSRHPAQLQWPLTIREDFAAITAADISGLAAHYLKADRAAQVIIRPAATGVERTE